MREVAEVGGFTRMGKLHDKNEDAFHLDPQRRLVMVADGMGGHQAGETASALAKEAAVQQFQREPLREQPPSKPRADIGTQLKKYIFFAHQLLKQAQQEHPEELGGMGCALVVASWDEERWHVANVGDVRAYSYSGGALRKLTRDHSVVASLVEGGYISPEEALKHPLRHQLTQAVGHEDIKPDLTSAPIREGGGEASWLVVCSDGVWDSIGDGGIAEVLSKSGDPRDASRELVNRAWETDGRDDCTAVAVKIQSPKKEHEVDVGLLESDIEDAVGPVNRLDTKEVERQKVFGAKEGN